MIGSPPSASIFAPILVHILDQTRSFKRHFPKRYSLCYSGYAWRMPCNAWFNFYHQTVSLLLLKRELQDINGQTKLQDMNGKNGYRIDPPQLHSDTWSYYTYGSKYVTLEPDASQDKFAVLVIRFQPSNYQLKQQRYYGQGDFCHSRPMAVQESKNGVCNGGTIMKTCFQTSVSIADVFAVTM